MEQLDFDLDQIRKDLSILRRLRGCKKVDRAFGRSSSQVRRRLSGEVQLTAHGLLALLKSMEIEPTFFLAFAEAGFHPEIRLHQLENDEPDQVRYLKRDLLSKPPAATYTVDELRQKALALQELRVVHIDRARQEALEILRTTRRHPKTSDPRSECEAWGILAACQRDRRRYSSAAFCLRRALQIPGDRWVPTLQRIANLLSDLGEFDRASAVLAAAATKASGNCQALGRVLVSTGGLRGKTGDLEDARRSYQAGLSLLPEADWYGRFAAYVGLGLNYASQSHPDRALRELENALQEAEGCPAFIPWPARWLKAEILLQQRRLPDACSEFAAVREIFLNQSMSTLDTALVSIRLAEVLFLLRDRARLQNLVVQMLSLLEPIQRQHSLLAGAYGEFLRIAMAGELTERLLESIYRRMHSDSKMAPPLLASRRR